MEKRFDVIGLGELLIDFTDAGKSAGGQRLFEQNPGGAPANLLTAVSHMGGRTAFIGKVGADMHGQFLKETLEGEGIDTSGLILDREVFTTLAFVGIGKNGEREFAFARKPGADTMLKPEELKPELLKSASVFHIGSLSLTDEPSRSATYEAVRIAKSGGAVISYDPNYRESLWRGRDAAVSEMFKMVTHADMMKVSDEESFLLTGLGDYRKAAQKLLTKGPALVAVTLGGDGVYVASRTGCVQVPGFQVDAVDTTGAGDSFWGGFLSRYITCKKRPEELDKDDLTRFARFGNAVAALCVQKRGGIPAIPTEREVERMLG
ncbi:carbohydrate kinase [Clostridium sp. AN503]|uniref:carbohydrate kinase family protein n=1 Tax=Clostridium sp. AN503 TaxID=3160598 RepID=UPI003457A0FA